MATQERLIDLYIQWTKNIPRPLANYFGKRYSKDLANLQSIIARASRDLEDTNERLSKHQKLLHMVMFSLCNREQIVLDLGDKLKTALEVIVDFHHFRQSDKVVEKLLINEQRQSESKSKKKEPKKVEPTK